MGSEMCIRDRSAPEARVAVITGDGELLMNVGALCTVANQTPANLSIICVDNACHGETGGQASMTAELTNLAAIAAGAGIGSVLTISSEQEIEVAAGFLTDSAAPRFLCCRVIAGPPVNFNRDLDLARCRRRFRNAYLAAADLTRADLTGADLTRARMTSSILTGGGLSDAELDSSDFSRAKLVGADLSTRDRPAVCRI